MALLTDQVAIVHRPPATKDAYGNDVFDWSTATRTTATGSLQPATTRENADDRQATVSTHTLYLEPSAEVSAVDRVSLDGVDYEVAGEPQVWRANGRPHHLVVPLNRMTA